jgi:hypothetical protein
VPVKSTDPAKTVEFIPLAVKNTSNQAFCSFFTPVIVCVPVVMTPRCVTEASGTLMTWMPVSVTSVQLLDGGGLFKLSAVANHTRPLRPTIHPSEY